MTSSFCAFTPIQSMPTLDDRFAPFNALLNRICQQQPIGWRPLFINGERWGCIHGKLGERIASLCEPYLTTKQQHNHIHQKNTKQLRESETQHNAACSTETRPLHLTLPIAHIAHAFGTLGTTLRQEGWVPNWRNECQPLLNPQGQPIGELERALFRTFGFTSQAIHIHVQTTEGLVWNAVRAWHKKDHPGAFDNLCAGGLGVQETPEDCAQRELFEEAGLSAAELTPRGLQHVQSFRVSRVHPCGWHDEICHLFCATIRPNLRPANQDGEVQRFQLMTPQACIDAINRGRFTPDAGLCCALKI